MPNDVKVQCNYCGEFKEMKEMKNLEWYAGFICKKCYKLNQEDN